MDRIESWTEKRAPHLDKIDIGFGLVMAVAIWITVYFDWLSGSHAIAMVTAVTAFAGIYQLRHPTETLRPAVREDFDTDSNKTDFGFRNFGPGPALYIQFVVKVNGESRVKLNPQDPPIHLSEGEFVGFQFDQRTDGTLWDADDSHNRLEGDVRLHYSYVTEQGLREPVNLNISEYRDSQCLFEELTADDQDTRTIDLETVRRKCLGEPSIA